MWDLYRIDFKRLNLKELRHVIKELADLVPGKCYTKEEYKNNLSELIDRVFFGK